MGYYGDKVGISILKFDSTGINPVTILRLRVDKLGEPINPVWNMV